MERRRYASELARWEGHASELVERDGRASELMRWEGHASELVLRALRANYWDGNAMQVI